MKSLSDTLAALSLCAATSLAQGPLGKEPAARWPAAPLGRRVPQLEHTLAELQQAVFTTPERQRDLQRSAWRVLAFVAQGSTMRNGHEKQGIRQLTVWLKRGTSPNNGPGPVDASTPRELHLLVTFTIARVAMESSYRLLIQASTNSWRDVLTKFTAADAPPPTLREAALLVMLAQTVEHTWNREFAAGALELAREAVQQVPRGRDRLGDAVRHVLELRDGAQHPPELTTALCWPACPTRSPFQAFFAAFVTRHLPRKLRARQWSATARLLDARAEDGLWDVPERLDRDTAGAMILSVLGACYEPGGFGEPPAQEQGAQDAGPRR